MGLHARLLSAVAAAALAVGAAQPAPPLPQAVQPWPGGLSGTLVFQSDRAGRPAIYTLALTTGTVARLSGEPGWSETNPRWSPDGRQVVFASNRAHYEGAAPERGTADMDLWLVNADGTGRRRLTTDPANESDPAWDADGRSIVFSSDRDSRGDLYRLRLDTGVTTRLTTHYVGRAIMPAVAASSGRVAFAAQTLRMGAFWDFQVHLLDPRSGVASPLPASAGACWPAWSRDGRRLAHVNLGKDEPSSLLVRTMPDGASTRVPGPRELWSYYPEWSPDDTKLAFAVSPAHHEGENWDLAVVDLKTGAWTRLTEGPGNDRLPDWTP
ncbi:MAG: TolB family protein [Vicinamibacterales bacterium]